MTIVDGMNGFHYEGWSLLLKIRGYNGGNIFCQINRNGISYHLFNISLASLEMEFFREGLYQTAFLCCQRPNPILTANRIIRMYLITIGHGTVNSSNGWTRFINTKDSSPCVTTRMTIVIFYSQRVSKVVSHRHWLFGKVCLKCFVKETVVFSQNTHHEETFSLLGNSAITGIKNLEREAITSFLEYFFCLDEFVCFDNSVNILHYKNRRLYLANDFRIVYRKVSTAIVFITFSC